MGQFADVFCQFFTRTVIILINIAFIFAGVLTMAIGWWADTHGWLTIFNSQNLRWIAPVSTAWIIMTLGILILFLALLGCCGAWNKNRCFLAIYSLSLIVSILLFLSISVGAFVSMRVADVWQYRSYPADNREPMLARNFNELYCYSESLHFCNNVPAPTLLELFFGVQVATDFEAQAKNSTLRPLHASTMIEYCEYDEIRSNAEYAPACLFCDHAAPYTTYKAISKWISGRCYPTPASANWCKVALLQEIGEGEVPTADWPYAQCRVSFLNLWYDFSKYLGISGVLLMSFCILIFILSCKLIKSRKPYEYEALRADERQQLLSPSSQDETEPEVLKEL